MFRVSSASDRVRISLLYFKDAYDLGKTVRLTRVVSNKSDGKWRDSEHFELWDRTDVPIERYNYYVPDQVALGYWVVVPVPALSHVVPLVGCGVTLFRTRAALVNALLTLAVYESTGIRYRV